MEGYHQLSLDEREQLYLLRQEGISLRQIAHRMKRCVSTISREIRRNSDKKLGYTPDRAHTKTISGHSACPLKLYPIVHLSQRTPPYVAVSRKWLPATKRRSAA